MNSAAVIAKHEFRHICREPQFLLPYFLIPLLTIGIYAAYLLTFDSSQSEGDYISRLLTVLVGVLVTSMTLALSADSFAGEKERNTLEIFLCVPVSLRQIFWGKVLGIVPLPVCMAWLGQTVILCLALTGDYMIWSVSQVLSALVLTPVSAFFITSLATFISLKAETVRGAAQTSGIIILLYLFCMQAISHWYFLSPWNAAGVLAGLVLISLMVIFKSMTKFEAIIYSVR